MASRVGLTLLFIGMLIVGYFLMLMVMSFNVGVIFMISLGLGVGQFIFELIGLPSLPSQYRQIAGSGAYMPVSDSCCNKIECCTTIEKNECQHHMNPNSYDHLMQRTLSDEGPFHR